MSFLNAPRERFTDGALTTASGPRVIGLAYDRLDRDLEVALVALDRKDLFKAHESLVHAQDIVYELMYMIDFEKWDHAGDLSSIYRFVIDMLVRANVAKQPAEVVAARAMLADLGDAFRQAAHQVATEHAATQHVTVPTDQPEQRRISVRA